MQLRDYQEAAVTSATEFLAKGINPLVIAPTGAGKTVIASEIMRRWQVANPGKTVIFVAHRMELLIQAEKTMERFGVTGKVVSVFTREFAGIDLEARRTALVVFDEAHHAVASSWTRFSEVFTGPKVAVTATPDRLDRQRVESVGFVQSYEIQIRTLIEQGHLVRPMAQKMPVEMSMIRMKGYDDALAAVADSMVDEMRRWDRKKAIAFLPDVECSERLAGLLRDRGVKADHADGNSGNMRAGIVEQYKTGDLQVLCNVNLFTEGFDAPETDCVVLLRPTQSRSLWSQMIGRGLRTAPGKTDCLILDPMWLSGEHSLQPADAFTKHPYAQAPSVSDSHDPLAVAESADVHAEENMLRRIAKEEAKASAKEAIALGLVDLSVACMCFGFVLPAPAAKTPALADQTAWLASRGVHARGLTEDQAQWMIGRLKAREAMELATVKQVRKLRQFGVRNPERMTKNQASKAIGSDWRITGSKPRFNFHR